jgi:hypothetical protein
MAGYDPAGGRQTTDLFPLSRDVRCGFGSVFVESNTSYEDSAGAPKGWVDIPKYINRIALTSFNGQRQARGKCLRGS